MIARYNFEAKIDDSIRGEVLHQDGITLAGGQGKIKGKIFRIGHLGYADDWDVLAAVAAVERALSEQNHPVEIGKGVAAAERVLFAKRPESREEENGHVQGPEQR